MYAAEVPGSLERTCYSNDSKPIAKEIKEKNWSISSLMQLEGATCVHVGCTR